MRFFQKGGKLNELFHNISKLEKEICNLEHEATKKQRDFNIDNGIFA